MHGPPSIPHLRRGFKAPSDKTRFPRWVKLCVKQGYISQTQADILTTK